MKLAEALSERADIQKRMQQLCARLRRNALVQEGEKPAEDPHALLEEYGRLCERYEELIRRTNLTNAATTDGGEITLTDYSQAGKNYDCDNCTISVWNEIKK